ncbi:MAG: peroxidase, partial [Actinomycetota bacterium]|nr:peroxidase [Actinomycetota bacterium]
MSDETRNPASQDNTRIPAGFTYLGQFIDHDITFDPTPLPEQRRDPHALVNFRTPRYDLDSLYGSGPVVQPYLYDWESKPKGARLLVGAN